MRSRFSEELKELHSSLLMMSVLCEDAISCALKALFEQDRGLAEKVNALEAQINSKEKEIDKHCVTLILREQPIAGDLRDITTAQKMIVDMERIGDQAQDIAEISGYCACTGVNIVHIIPLRAMAAEAIGMLSMSIDAFMAQDELVAVQAIARDDVIDRLFLECKKSLVQQIRQNSIDEESALDLLMVAKYLERIGDHSENIAQQVIYSIHGEYPGEQA